MDDGISGWNEFITSLINVKMYSYTKELGMLNILFLYAT
jgi:hypothetical protein